MIKRLLKYHNLPEDLNTIPEANRVFYFGVDPTSAGIHVGHLIGLKLALELLDLGWRGFILVGGFTGSIGDPTDKNEARKRVDPMQTEEMAMGILGDLQQIFKNHPVTYVNNLNWLEKMPLRVYFEYLYGISINNKVHMDTFQKRLDNQQHLSAAEFSYPDLQMMDWHYLYTQHNVCLQIGGQDQWGNISFGIRQLKTMTKSEHIYGACTPLLTTDGAKLGKTTHNNMVRDGLGTYNMLMQLPDTTTKELLFLLNGETYDDPVQTKYEVIRCVFMMYFGGLTEWNQIKTAQDKLFYGSLAEVTEFTKVHKNNLANIIKILQLAPSNNEARRLIEAGGVRLNDDKEFDDKVVTVGQYKLSVGKKQIVYIDVIDSD